MAPRSRTKDHGAWHPAPDFICGSPFDSTCPRHEEPPTQATTPCDAVPQTPEEADASLRVCPESPPPVKSWNENGKAQEEQSKRSRHLEDDEAKRKSEANARDRNSSTDDIYVADPNHVNGQRISHDGSCNIDIPEHGKPLPELEDDAISWRTYRSFPWEILVWRLSVRKYSESLRRYSESLRKYPRWFRTHSESFRRLSEMLRKSSEELQSLLDCSPNFFCGFWKTRFDFLFKSYGVREKATGCNKGLDSLPGDLHENRLRRVPFKKLSHAKAVSKSKRKDLIERDAVFRRPRGLSPGEGTYTAFNSFIKDKKWVCAAFNLLLREWQPLPALNCLPSPDFDLFQEYSMCGHRSLMCANVSKSSHKEELIVFNIMTGEMRVLPPLKHSRNPVLLHIWVDPVTDSYKVIAAGSASSSGEKDLSRRVEVYDSLTSAWKTGSDIPGPEFGLNEHQVGVTVDEVLYFLMFLNGDDGQKGVVAFDIENLEWLEDRTCPVPFSSFCNTLQLLESSGRLCLFSEQERDKVVEHCIDVLEFCQDSDHGEPEFSPWQWRSVVRVLKSGGRGLLVYPENICVPFGIGKVCIFNTINRDGVVYDLDNGMQSGVLEAPPENQRGENFFCLNPVSFTLAPNPASKP